MKLPYHKMPEKITRRRLWSAVLKVDPVAGPYALNLIFRWRVSTNNIQSIIKYSLRQAGFALDTSRSYGVTGHGKSRSSARARRLGRMILATVLNLDLILNESERAVLLDWMEENSHPLTDTVRGVLKWYETAHY